MTGVYTVRKRKEEVMNVVAEAGSIYIVHPQAVKPNPSHRPHELYKSGNTLVAIRSSREEKKNERKREHSPPFGVQKFSQARPYHPPRPEGIVRRKFRREASEDELVST
jgi:hypothetical protein